MSQAERRLSPLSDPSAWDLGSISHNKSVPGPGSALKARVALACKRCKRRKQRCDGSHPTCRSCERAGIECTYEKTIRPQYPGGKLLYINALEERIALLESRLPAYAEDHFEAASTAGQGIDHAASDASSSSVSGEADAEKPSSLVNGVAYLSLCASGTTDIAPEPFYLGPSSGATIARMVQSSIFLRSTDRALAEAVATVEPQTSYRSSNRSATGCTTPMQLHTNDVVFEFPFLDQARLLFDVFFDRIHTRWPLLDRKQYTQLFDTQYDQGALCLIQRSIMHLIYAISATFLQLTRRPSGVDPEKHLLAAIEPMDYILEQHNLGTVQFLLLLALHGQRSPYGAGAWSQVRFALSLAIELGLHRKPPSSSSSPQKARDTEIRRRAFWSCYCLDRGTSVVLGRTFAIADRDINVELPSLSAEFWDLTNKGSLDASLGQHQWSNIEPFIHVTKLERIGSRIHKTIFRVDKDIFAGPPEQRAKLDIKMARIRADLDNWIQTIPNPPKDAKSITWMYDPESTQHDSRHFYNLQYHKSVLVLFTVLLPTLGSSDPNFITTARSAACVCIAYRRLNQNQTLSYTFISLHSCFVAGLTLMYCLWRDHSLFSFDMLDATRACSQSLTIFGEKWPGAVKYRDIFDALSTSLFKMIVNPGTSASAAATGLTIGTEPVLADSGTALGQRAEVPSGAPKSDTPMDSCAPSEQSPNTSDWKPAISHLVSDAVKEAFMEVDEEAPGGWQGWRMWHEMVQDTADGEQDYVDPFIG